MAWGWAALFYSGEELVRNPGFEEAPTGGTEVERGSSVLGFKAGQSIAGWDVDGQPDAHVVAWATVPNKYLITPQAGSHFVDLTGYRDFPPAGDNHPGRVTQVVPTRAGTRYALLYHIGVSGSQATLDGPVSVQTTVDPTADGPVTFERGLPETRKAETTWKQFGLVFVATGPTRISFAGTRGNAFIGLDEVSVRRATWLAYVVDILVRRFASIRKRITPGPSHG